MFFKLALYSAYLVVMFCTISMIILTLNIDIDKYYMLEVLYGLIWPVGFFFL